MTLRFDWRFLMTAFCVFSASGCQREAPRHPVTGTLTTAAGEPVTGGGLILIPTVWTGDLVNGSLRADGTFVLTTSRSDCGVTVVKDGCPAGEYRVTYQPVASGDKIIPGIELTDTIKIVAGTNTLKIQLPSPPKPDTTDPEKSNHPETHQP